MYQYNPLLLEDSPLYLPWSDKNYVGARNATFHAPRVGVIDTPGRTAARKADVEAAFAPGKRLPSKLELMGSRNAEGWKRAIEKAALNKKGLSKWQKAIVSHSRVNNPSHALLVKRFLKK